jgi:hypothetical protein
MRIRDFRYSVRAVLVGLFAAISACNVLAADSELILPLSAASAATRPSAEPDLAFLSTVGQGHYQPLPLKKASDQRVSRFDTSFEECAPGRNSAANEWSAFGAEGDRDFNAIGRDMHVRYPLYDLVFCMDDGGREIRPGGLDSFRLGLVNNRLPAIWGGWRYGDLLYKVSVMTVPDPQSGNFDLYKLQIQNPGDAPADSKLAAVLEGPPDMRMTNGVVRGLGDAPLLLADPPAGTGLTCRDWGLCDKRAKAYATGAGPGKTEAAVTRYRLGLDGVPVVYRFKAEPGKRYVVYLVSTPHIDGYLLEKPDRPGDLVYEYRVEGAEPQTLDYVEYMSKQSRPLCIGLEGGHDVNGDGYVEVSAGVTAGSRIRHTRLSVIYVFPEGTTVADAAAVYSGSMNQQCVWHINVGATPEQDGRNQEYDKSDIGFARFHLNYGGQVGPHETQTWWLKVPPIHRREPVSMGYIAHAFREVLPGEAVPPFPAAKIEALKTLDPVAAERETADHWEAFFAKAARIDVPDPVLNDLFLSRLATRAILDITITDGVVYNACSPFFYFDHAYRDQAYVVFAYDLAGLHDRAERILHAYCMDVKDVKKTGPISFDGKPLQLGMLDSGLWNTRPSQFDTQGQNIWALVQHYKLSGRRDWMEKTAYPYVRRAATWIVNSRHKHMEEVKDPQDARYGLIEPGAMEVINAGDVGKGMHMYYMNAFAILGLQEAADAAGSLGLREDCERFTAECRDLKQSLRRSFEQTFKRTGLYEGHLWFGVEPSGVGMYGFWAHNCLLWPCRALGPQDPMLTATWRRMDMMSQQWGGGMFSERQGEFWPYIGVDRAISHILRGEPDRTLDYFCAYVDTAGGTLSWGEGYENLIATGDQPHFWADGQYVNLLRHLFVMEDGPNLLITPALFRRWHQGTKPVAVHGLPTHFGDLDLTIQPQADGNRLDYHLRITPKGDQAARELAKIILYPRTADGRPIGTVSIDGHPTSSFTDRAIVIPQPSRSNEMEIVVTTRQ